ncbi:hypothetical protein [Yoonia maritima]|uniref:hypothetical protein n=1 Tax=Yoonia maritima TaxID=1435347 RepID=UPI000D10AC94|nr:hypothetical protein [Yoonia maritima]
MSRSLIIIGNGIGMALDPDKFSLKHVMPDVWKNGCLNTSQKELIADCLEGVEKDTGPTAEDQMMRAQLAQLGHELITDVVEKEKRENWFTGPALTYPEAISIYVYNVARQLDKNSKEFHDSPDFKAFLNNIIPFINETKSHVATLNYDTLFYSAFNDGHTVDETTYKLGKKLPSETTLNDGYRKDGFLESNFDRLYSHWDFGYCLHLHGSPLIVDGEERAKKLQRHEVCSHMPKSAKHVILSDGALKPHLINRSDVLKLYWDMFNKAIEEASEVIVIGYGGGDDHINAALEKYDKPIRIIEWRDPSVAQSESETFWSDKLGINDDVLEDKAKFELIRKDNILAFSDWEKPSEEIPF